MITYRKATIKDINWIVSVLAKDMFSLLGEEELPDYEYLKETFLPILINTGICIIAEQDNIQIGCIGGLTHPILYNPNKKSLTELFWWVREESRGTSVGAKLLLLFEGAGLDIKVDYINMSIMPNTVLNKDSLIKRGYIHKESSYVRKI